MNETTTKKKRGRPKLRDEIPSPYTKIGKGVPLRGQARELVCNVGSYFEAEKDNGGPLLPCNSVNKRSAAALNLSEHTVSNIWKEKQVLVAKGGQCQLRTPPKKRHKEKTVTHLDGFQQDAIRRHIYSYIERKEYPTLKKLISSLKETD